MPAGAVLLAVAEAAVDRDPERMAAAREGTLAAIGPEGLVDAAAVLANFDGIARVASGTGIRLDPAIEKHGRGIRAKIGIADLRKTD